MAATSNGITDAMNRIAGMLGAPPAPAGPATSTATPPAGTSTTAAAALTPEQQQAIASQIFYSLQVPPITQADLLEMERNLPDLVDLLHSLASRPAAHAELTAAIAAAQAGSPGGRAAPDPQALNDLAQAIAQDAFGSTNERFLPLVAAGLAFFMAGYTIAHQWKT